MQFGGAVGDQAGGVGDLVGGGGEGRAWISEAAAPDVSLTDAWGRNLYSRQVTRAVRGVEENNGGARMRRVLALGASLSIAIVAAGCGSTDATSTPTTTGGASSTPTSTPTTGPVKAAWIYVGPHDDHGWSQAHDDGRVAVEQALGTKVQTTYKENIAEPAVGPVIDQLIADGNKIIFATSFGYQPAMVAAAAAHPDVKFEMATGYETAANLSAFYGAGEDAIYLSGMAAGAATKNGVIGYIAPFPIPEVIRHVNAFALGAQKTHPGAKIKVIWTKSWFDLAGEAKAAQSLHDAGADVIGQNVDSSAAGQVAEKAGVPWVGYDSDQSQFAPTQYLTGAIYHWGPYETKEVQAVIDGTWKSGNYYGNIGDGFTDLAPFGPSVSQATKDAIAAEMARLKTTPEAEFTGPLKDQSGAEKVPAGTTLGMDTLGKIDWFVQGIEGSPKG